MLDVGALDFTLRLDPKKPDDEPHHHLVLKVRKADHVVAGVDYFNAETDQPVRRITATNIKALTQPLAHRIEAEDLKTGRKSVAELSDVKFDTGLEDSFFTQRYLKRSR